MTSNHRRPPTEHWYVTSSADSVGKRKVEQLQRQINSIEDEMKERRVLINKLSKLDAVENEKKDIQGRVMERHGSPARNSPARSSPGSQQQMLEEELERLYGHESKLKLTRDSPLDNRNVMQTVIQHRTKEFSQKQQNSALQAKYLEKERRRLQDARQRVQEQRRQLLESISPTEGGKRSAELAKPIQGVDSLIRQTVDKLPTTIDKIWGMREDMEKHYQFYKKPYLGELGIRSYEHWQLGDYFMCKVVVDEMVENFLDRHFKHDNIEKGTYKAMLDGEQQWMQKQAQALSEKKAVQLIAEELVLDETSGMIDEVIKEMYHMYGSFRNMTDALVMQSAETVCSGTDVERDPLDKAYNMVTKAFFSTKENRNKHRKEIWGHSQHTQNKATTRQVARVAPGDIPREGPAEPLRELVEEEEDQEWEHDDRPMSNIMPEAISIVSDDEDADAPDVTILDFNTISPIQIRSLPPTPTDSPEVILDKQQFQHYMSLELEYWSNMTPSVLMYTLSKKCHGIRSIHVSPNHRFVAIATHHGDLIVYDALMIPWRPFRCYRYKPKTDDFLVSVAWSLDNTRLIVINTLGYLQVLSLTGGAANSADAKQLGLSADDRHVFPAQFLQLLDLDVKRKDFIFQHGTLAEDMAQVNSYLLPVNGAFFPSLTLFGTQNDMVVALENGDVLKCNFQNALKLPGTKAGPRNEAELEDLKIYKTSQVIENNDFEVSTIGRYIEAELFRSHKAEIIYMCFVDFLNAMVTVDSKGYVNKWKYVPDMQNPFGWFFPAKKYRLRTTKTIYRESTSDRPQVVFTEEIAPGNTRRTRQDVAAQRRAAEDLIASLNLGDPWHEEEHEEDRLIMQVFAPHGVVSQSGAVFHVVYRHKDTKQLSMYKTRLFKPVNVKFTKLVQVFSSPTSTEIVFVLLFKRFSPKGAHFTIFVLDLTTFTLTDFRKDIPIRDEDYTAMMESTIFSCSVTRTFGPTGSDYLFLMFNGKLSCVSLTSGQVVEITMDTRFLHYDFGGCIVDSSTLPVPDDTQCTAVCFDGSIYCICYGKTMNGMYVVKFGDENVDEQRRTMWESYSALSHTHHIPPELRVDTNPMELSDIQHPAVEVRKLLLSHLDTGLWAAGHVRDNHDVIKDIALSDKVTNYKALNQQVTDANVLEKEGIWEPRVLPQFADTISNNREPRISNS